MFYKNDDLYTQSLNKARKRPRSEAFSESSLLEKVKGVVVEDISSRFHEGIIQSLVDIIPIIDRVNEDILDHGSVIQDYEDYALYEDINSE